LELNVSETVVPQLLRLAREEGLVTCAIPMEGYGALKLAEFLKKQFLLKDVIVVPQIFARGRVIDEETMKKAVALEAARYLQRTIHPEDVVGVAWGGTIHYLIQCLNPCQMPDTPFLTLHGRLPCCDEDLNVHTLVDKMAAAFGGTGFSLLHDGRIQQGEDIGEVLHSFHVQNMFQMFHHITIAVSGIGAFYPKISSPLANFDYLRPEELKELQQKGVVADFLLRFLDRDGKEIESTLKDMTLSIGLDDYKHIPLRIVVASGAHKSHALRAVLLGNLADVLVLDNALAEAIYPLW